MAPNAFGARLPACALVTVLCISGVAGCAGQGAGEDGSVGASDLPSATRSVTRSVELPSATRSRPDPTPDPPTGTSEAPAPTDGQPTRTREPDTAAPTTEAPAGTRPPGPTDTINVTGSAPSPSATQAEAETSTDEDDDTPWWWLAGLLALAAVLTGVVLIRRHRRRAAWSAGLADALGEATWLSHDLVATLRSQGDGRAGVWEIGRPRVLRLEHALEPLAEQATDPVTARHCAALASAVQVLRTMLDQADATGDLGAEATTMALRQAQHELDETIVVLQET